MSIKEQIEAEAEQASTLHYFSSDGQKVSAGLNPIKNEAWQAGALWAMRWCLERVQRAHFPEDTGIFEGLKAASVARVELAEAAKEVLG